MSANLPLAVDRPNTLAAQPSLLQEYEAAVALLYECTAALEAEASWDRQQAGASWCACSFPLTVTATITAATVLARCLAARPPLPPCLCLPLLAHTCTPFRGSNYTPTQFPATDSDLEEAPVPQGGATGGPQVLGYLAPGLEECSLSKPVACKAALLREGRWYGLIAGRRPSMQADR